MTRRSRAADGHVVIALTITEAELLVGLVSLEITDPGRPQPGDAKTNAVWSRVYEKTMRAYRAAQDTEARRAADAAGGE